jgi:hypothetical protein
MAMDKHEAAARLEGAWSALDALAGGLRAVEELRGAIAAIAAENASLRHDNTRLAKALTKTGDEDPVVASTLHAAKERAEVSQQQIQALLDAQTEAEAKVLELEELNASMMSMYVSSFQLHATLDLAEVIRVIEEILVNFIGARSYAVMLSDDQQTMKVVAESGLESRLPMTGVRPRGVLAEAITTHTAYVHTSSRPAREGVLAAVPLVMSHSVVGALVVYELLAQKERFVESDIELFSLLGQHAASAVVACQAYAKADRKVKTLQAMLQLLDEPDPSE